MYVDCSHNAAFYTHKDYQYAQELLSTFSTSLGEVSLLPATGGVFVVEIYQSSSSTPDKELATVNKTVLWDRKIDGGFPETKVYIQKRDSQWPKGLPLAHGVAGT